MFPARWNEYSITRLDLLFAILIADFAVSFKDIDLMLPVVLMIGSEASGFDGEMTHKKIRRTIVTIDKPPYSRTFRFFFSDKRFRHVANVHLMQIRSLRDYNRRKINDALTVTIRR